jgi:hypothetical protein
MNTPTVALIGALGGSLIGLLGGVIGTYFGIRNTRTAAERQFMIRCSVAMWAWLVVLMIVPCLLRFWNVISEWTYWDCWAIAMAGLIWGIPRLNRRATELHQTSPSS